MHILNRYINRRNEVVVAMKDLLHVNFRMTTLLCIKQMRTQEGMKNYDRIVCIKSLATYYHVYTLHFRTDLHLSYIFAVSATLKVQVSLVPLDNNFKTVNFKAQVSTSKLIPR